MASKCITDDCFTNVSGLIEHVHCAVHRTCNSNSLSNPEACERCMVHWTNLKDNIGLAPTSRKLLKTLFKQMRGSSTFNKAVVFKNKDFRNTYWPLFRLKSSQPNEVISDSEQGRFY